MEPTWGPSGADRTHVGPMNFAIWDGKDASTVPSGGPLLLDICTSTSTDVHIQKFWLLMHISMG